MATWQVIIQSKGYMMESETTYSIKDIRIIPFKFQTVEEREESFILKRDGVEIASIKKDPLDEKLKSMLKSMS